MCTQLESEKFGIISSTFPNQINEAVKFIFHFKTIWENIFALSLRIYKAM